MVKVRAEARTTAVEERWLGVVAWWWRRSRLGRGSVVEARSGASGVLVVLVASTSAV